MGKNAQRQDSNLENELLLKKIAPMKLKGYIDSVWKFVWASSSPIFVPLTQYDRAT